MILQQKLDLSCKRNLGRNHLLQRKDQEENSIFRLYKECNR